MAIVEIKVPDIGDFSEVAVIELLVKPGDTVKAEQSLITVESDKASMEIPSSHHLIEKAYRWPVERAIDASVEASARQTNGRPPSPGRATPSKVAWPEASVVVS